MFREYQGSMHTYIHTCVHTLTPHHSQHTQHSQKSNCFCRGHHLSPEAFRILLANTLKYIFCSYKYGHTWGWNLLFSSRSPYEMRLKAEIHPSIWGFPYSFPFIRVDRLWKQRGMWTIRSTPAQLLWVFSWKVPRTHSVLFSFHPIQIWPNKDITCCLFPLSCGSSTADRYEREPQPKRKTVSVPCTVSAINASEWPPDSAPFQEIHIPHPPTPWSTVTPSCLAHGTEVMQRMSISPASCRLTSSLLTIKWPGPVTTAWAFWLQCSVSLCLKIMHFSSHFSSCNPCTDSSVAPLYLPKRCPSSTKQRKWSSMGRKEKPVYASGCSSINRDNYFCLWWLTEWREMCKLLGTELVLWRDICSFRLFGTQFPIFWLKRHLYCHCAWGGSEDPTLGGDQLELSMALVLVIEGGEHDSDWDNKFNSATFLELLGAFLLLGVLKG